MQTIKERADLCRACEWNDGVVEKFIDTVVWRSRCKKCGCSGLSLERERCPIGKWENPDVPGPGKLPLRNLRRPGDVIAMTASIRDLQRQYPMQFDVSVHSFYPELFEGNPHVVSATKVGVDAEPDGCLAMSPDAIGGGTRQGKMHYIEAYHRQISNYANKPVTCGRLAPDLHLGREEMASWPGPIYGHYGFTGKYWVVFSGGAKEPDVKWWPTEYYQAVVDAFKDTTVFVQAGAKNGHHPPLDGAINMVGKTTLRQLMRLMYWSEGVISGNSMPMHMAAGLPWRTSQPKPCIVIGGGREDVVWYQYQHQQSFHTIGQIDCCASHGCWKARVNSRGLDDTGCCVHPTQGYAGCMAMIRPEEVVASIRRYYDSGFLEPTAKDCIEAWR